MLAEKEQPKPGAVSEDMPTADLTPAFKLPAGQAVAFNHVTYRTRYRVPITCGNAAINRGPQFRFINSSVGLSREDTYQGSKSLFESTWQELCATTDAQQDAEDAKWDRRHHSR
jgi:hypothetical protein